MRVVSLFILLLASCGLVCPAPNVCPSVCNCSELQRVVCWAGKLEDIPWNLPNPYGLRNLDLRGNKIQALTTRIASYPNLEILDLSENEIGTIGDKIFDVLNALTMLFLRDNQLRLLRPQMFEGLRSLRELDLSLNQLEVLSEDAFSALEGLEKLDLERNRLRGIHPNAFRNLSKLRVLQLCDNFLDVVPPLGGLSELKSLYLDRNRIEEIPPGVLRDATELQLLSINANLISRITDGAFNSTRGCSRLETLSLRDNQLLKMFQRACLGNLKVLDLSGNLMEVFTASDFRGLPQLLMLNLSKMPNLKTIRSGAFSAQRTLRELVIASNHQLSSIDPGSFGSAVDLRRLDLHGNSLEVLDRDLVSWDDLEFLDLRFNPWRCDCRLTWLHRLFAKTVSNTTQFLQLETRCSRPPHLATRRIIELTENDMVCIAVETAEQVKRENEDKILFGLLGGVCGLLFVIMLFVLFKCRSSFLNPSSGTYPYAPYIHPSPRRLRIHRSAEELEKSRHSRAVQANREMASKAEEPLAAIPEKKSEVRFQLEKDASA